MFHKQRLRLLFLLAVMLLTAFVAVTWFNYRLVHLSIRDELATSSLSLLRDNIYSEIMKSLVPPMNISSSMANDAFLINWILEGEQDESVIRQYLENIRRQYNFDSAFFVSAKTGNYYHHKGILKQISSEDPHDVWYYRFVESGHTVELDVDSDEAAGGTLTIFVNYRLRDFSGGLLGVTGVGLRMTGFTRFLEEKQKRYNRIIYLTDEKGVIQVHSRVDMVESASLYDLPGHSKIAGRLLEKGSGPVYDSFISAEGEVLVTALYMPETRWFLVVEQEGSRSLDSLKSNFIWMIAAGILIAVVVVVISVLTLNSYQKKMEMVAKTDELTQVSNRYEMDSVFDRMMRTHARTGVLFSLIILDIDRFKQINDSLGHLTGDRVLVRISVLLKKFIRGEDLLARYGGDEFVLILSCPLEAARQSAERLRKAMEDQDLTDIHPAIGPVTISLGLAEYRAGDTLESLIMRADKALYVSKEGGRNRLSLGETSV
jgi:diguanylate cyclase (GGDEF)-like protein